MLIEDNLELSSDHSPIVLTLSENIIQKIPNPVLTLGKHQIGARGKNTTDRFIAN